MKVSHLSAAIAALVAADPLFVAAAPAALTTRALLLVQRADAAHREGATVPSCARYQGTVGARTRSDLYLVTPPCRRPVEEEQQRLLVPYSMEDVADHQQEHGAIGALFWLRPDTIDLGDSRDPQLQRPAQFVLTADGTSPCTVQDLLATLEPTFAPSYVTDLGSQDGAGTEGALVSLDASNSTHRFHQLEYLTSHPLLAHHTLVAVPLSTSDPVAAPSSVDSRNPYPDVPDFAIQRIRHHLAALEFQPTLSAVIKSLDGEKAEQRIRQDVQVLSGEDQSALHEHEKVSSRRAPRNADNSRFTQTGPRANTSDLTQWVSRHSMSQGGHRASNWVHGESDGALAQASLGQRPCNLLRLV